MNEAAENALQRLADAHWDRYQRAITEIGDLRIRNSQLEGLVNDVCQVLKYLEDLSYPHRDPDGRESYHHVVRLVAKESLEHINKARNG